MIILLTIILLVGAGPVIAETEQAQFTPRYAAVLADKVNIRAGQGLNFEIIGQLNKANRVVVVGQKRDWYKIKLPQAVLCFVHQDYVEQALIQANKLRVRAGAGTNFNVLGILKRGERVKIVGQEGAWLKIAPPDNCNGWIKKKYLQLTKRAFVPPETTTASATMISGQDKMRLKDSKPEKTSTKQIEAQGTIDELGKFINRQGTHKLIKNKKVTYYLNSEQIDLNLYVWQKVKVTGRLTRSKDSPYPVIEVEAINVKP